MKKSIITALKKLIIIASAGRYDNTLLYKPDETIGAQYRHTQGYSFLVILKNIACSSKLTLFNDSINSVSIAR